MLNISKILAFRCSNYVFVAPICGNKYYICFFDPYGFFNIQISQLQEVWMSIMHVLCYHFNWLRPVWKNNYHYSLFVEIRRSRFTNTCIQQVHSQICIILLYKWKMLQHLKTFSFEKLLSNYSKMKCKF